jgi:hypothetical protein
MCSEHVLGYCVLLNQLQLLYWHIRGGEVVSLILAFLDEYSLRRTYIQCLTCLPLLRAGLGSREHHEALLPTRIAAHPRRRAKEVPAVPARAGAGQRGTTLYLVARAACVRCAVHGCVCRCLSALCAMDCDAYIVSTSQCRTLVCDVN